ncbi:CMP-binding-factor 1 [Lactobacillus helsingborgensis]|uniref:HD domain-containing protein n=1 Tax=Lactobacillus helsingborgensis TaxID=1218494 RepID=A0AA47B357_9LACO|nr:MULTISPECIES: HD domain-containing protein [Lactobacillus]AIS09499.1 3'->5' exoribonuclease Bsu YhaM [Lactobacillus sp. wkB8]KJY64240.1 CMP-binding-factor 1 [Lactobacillus helsingborgensis]MBC6355815.1 HD domain-containing protein [Lactobacillus helsingborgensis]MCT6811817.1 HD domain-containing protein [Lactobacillus helsingborgensis]MCT6827256.1 HD domain-containing protein [Lactobacillus helsingborgensis]
MYKRLLDYNDGEELELVVLIKNSQLRHTKKGKLYLAMSFGDSSGEIRGNFWDANDQDAATFNAGTIVELNGKREEYQGQPQIKIYSLRVVGPEEGYDLRQFIKSAPEKIADMKEEINQYVFEILNPTWNRIVRFLLKKWEKRFFEFPAGKSNHHAVRGGLAYHTVSMLRDAKGLATNYPQINRSLLYAGCILHDMGKVLELTGPAATQYTTEGNLIGHLVLIDEQIMLAAQQLKIDLESEDLLLLRHMVLSHHGKFEYGSPKLPALLEAELLHRIDDLDASIYAITNALQHTRPGNFTDNIMSQGGRKFYRPKTDESLGKARKLE